MTEVMKWTNDIPFVPLCGPTSFYPIRKPALEAIGRECFCVEVLSKQCTCANFSSVALDDVCSDCDSTFTWRIYGTDIVLSFDCTANSCIYTSSDGLWVLDISSGTLTYDSTNVWQSPHPWDCQSDNFVTSINPASGYPGFFCICPLDYVPECGSCVGCSTYVLPRCWELTVNGTFSDASCNNSTMTGTHTLVSGGLGNCHYQTEILNNGLTSSCICAAHIQGRWTLEYTSSTDTWVARWETYPGSTGLITFHLSGTSFKCNGTNVMPVNSVVVPCNNPPNSVPTSVTLTPVAC